MHFRKVDRRFSVSKIVKLLCQTSREGSSRERKEEEEEK